MTPELLKEIQSKKISDSAIKISNKNKFAKNIEKINFKEITINIYFPFYKKEQKISNIIKNKNSKEIKFEENNKEKELNLNNIIFQRHRSFDSSYNYYKKNDILNYNFLFDNEKKEIFSEKNEDSIISDYADISSDILNFKKEKHNEKNLFKINLESNSKKIRDAYYNKLITKLQWNPLKKIKIMNNLFFFDWDDTLLCTSFLTPKIFSIDNEISKKDMEIISNLDILASKLLLKAKSIGTVFIITNGAPGWVESSSIKYYPKTSNLLHKIKLISARGLCEKKYPGDMRQWKKFAFQYALETMKDINKNIVTNIFCFGDSNMEMEAAYYLKEFFPNAYLKTIKFKENPTHTELENELKIINAELDSIIRKFDKNLVIKQIRKKDEK